MREIEVVLSLEKLGFACSPNLLIGVNPVGIHHKFQRRTSIYEKMVASRWKL